jgi:lipoic acid synthetase
MAEFKGIPINGDAPRVKSGEKYTTPQGFTAVKDGVKKGALSEAQATLRKPPWLRAKLASGAGFSAVTGIVREHRLSTVCEEAKCPNIGECWNAGTATIMLMGAVCTRACRFCAVDTGNPRGWLDAEEPENVARSVSLMGLKYVVLTSVNRDDLPDGGARHYAAAIRAIKRVRTCRRFSIRAWMCSRRTWRPLNGSPTRYGIRAPATRRPSGCSRPPRHIVRRCSPRPA